MTTPCWSGLKYQENEGRSCRQITLAVNLLRVSRIAIGLTSPLPFGSAIKQDEAIKGITFDGNLPFAMRQQTSKSKSDVSRFSIKRRKCS